VLLLHKAGQRDGAAVPRYLIFPWLREAVEPEIRPWSLAMEEWSLKINLWQAPGMLWAPYSLVLETNSSTCSFPRGQLPGLEATRGVRVSLQPGSVMALWTPLHPAPPAPAPGENVMPKAVPPASQRWRLDVGLNPQIQQPAKQQQTSRFPRPLPGILGLALVFSVCTEGRGAGGTDVPKGKGARRCFARSGQI